MGRYLWWALVVLAAQPAMAQLDRVELRIAPEHVGLNGYVRPGTWTPLRLTLENQSAQPRRVLCQWMLADSDGDTVLSERAVTLTPNLPQGLWLYAHPPLTTSPRTVWEINVLDYSNDQPGRLLARERLSPRDGQLLDSRVRVVGVTGTGRLGLEPYETRVTQHEACRFVRGIEPMQLPDRWHGLAMLEALIWTADGGDPAERGVPVDAVREWVRRGGHLVVVMSNGVNYWPQSPLASMLPPVRFSRVDNVPPPSWLGDPFMTGDQRITVHRLDTIEPGDGSGPAGSVLGRDSQGRPLMVASGYGLGTVSMVGVDLTDPRVTAMNLPSGRYRIWNTLFGWRTPAFAAAYVQSQIHSGAFIRPEMRRQQELGDLIPRLVAMRGTTATALLLAVLLFGAYWLVAGPIGFAMLKRRGVTQHSWLAFVGTVAVFSLLTWGAAAALRPATTAIAHLSVVDAEAGSGLIRVQSWLSLFVPSHGDIEVKLEPEDDDGNGNTLSSPGMDPRQLESGFLEARRYAFDAAAPSRGRSSGTGRMPGIRLPMRATTKSLHLDYLGRPGSDHRWLADDWVMPRGDVRLVNFVPRGTLRHGLPDTLRNVRVFYCPGDGQEPFVLRVADWPAGEPLQLQEIGNTRLASPPTRVGERWGGFLGELLSRGVGQHPAPHTAQPIDIPRDQTVQRLWMLSFFGTLPPPDYEIDPNQTQFYQDRTPGYDRTVGREIDLSHTLSRRQLIIIGFLENSSLPAPLSVDGQLVPSHGWTVVRWRMAL